MATTILLNNTSTWTTPFSQMRELGSLVGSSVSSLFSKEEFTEVVAMRCGKEQFQAKKYLLDQRNGNLHIIDDIGTIRNKCCWLVAGLPLFTLLKMGYALGNTIAQVTKVFLRTIREVGQMVWNGNYAAAAWRLKQGACEATSIFGRGIWEVVKAPLFCIAGLFFLSQGLFSPYRGRRYFAELERIWNNHILFMENIKEDMRIDAKAEEIHHSQGECAKTCYSLEANLQNPYPAYLANCFQSRGIAEKDLKIIRWMPNLLLSLYP